MRLRIYVLDVGAPRWVKKLSAYVASSCAILAAASALVHAASIRIPNQFHPGDTLSAVTFNENFTTLQTAINAIGVTNPDCPIGYDRVTVSNTLVCKKGFDELIHVMSGVGGFWMDRYEASIWSNSDGSGTQYGASSDDFPSSFPKNGQVAVANLLFAVSRANVLPTAYVTWFQANVACRASGKQLLTADRWLFAARGTLDPGTTAGATSQCNTTGAVALATGLRGANCRSTVGAEDMIGNLKEWTAEWYSSIGTVEGTLSAWPDTIGGEYRGDGLWNVPAYSSANAGSLGWTTGVPVAAQRGGSYEDGTKAGRFAFSLASAPSDFSAKIGFRCMVPR